MTPELLLLLMMGGFLAIIAASGSDEKRPAREKSFEQHSQHFSYSVSNSKSDDNWFLPYWLEKKRRDFRNGLFDRSIPIAFHEYSRIYLPDSGSISFKPTWAKIDHVTGRVKAILTVDSNHYVWKPVDHY